MEPASIGQYLAIEAIDPGASGQRHGDPHFRFYQLENVRDTGFASAGQGVSPGSAEKNEVGPECEHPNDIEA